MYFERYYLGMIFLFIGLGYSAIILLVTVASGSVVWFFRTRSSRRAIDLSSTRRRKIEVAEKIIEKKRTEDNLVDSNKEKVNFPDELTAEEYSRINEIYNHPKSQVEVPFFEEDGTEQRCLNKGLFNKNYDPYIRPEPEDVSLSLSYPQSVIHEREFTLRISAYLPEQKMDHLSLLRSLSPRDQHLIDVQRCKWQRGTLVTVRVYSPSLVIDPEYQEFIWEGDIKILNFDCVLNEKVVSGSYLKLKVDISIAGIIIARLRADLKVDNDSSLDESTTTTTPIKTAFASCASADTDSVIFALMEIERNGVKIFWDRLSLIAGKDWQQQLCDAIKKNQAFLLFWSSNAKASEYVNWEWKTALECKGLEGIDPHPLESPSVAPPPEELSSLHFDDKYLYFRNR